MFLAQQLGTNATRAGVSSHWIFYPRLVGDPAELPEGEYVLWEVGEPSEEPYPMPTEAVRIRVPAAVVSTPKVEVIS
jgi:hypothetical protein